MDLIASRKRLCDFVRQELIGPSSREKQLGAELDEGLNGVNPTDVYVTGFLSPLQSQEELESDDDLAEKDDEGIEAQSQRRNRRYIPPSSAGLSFFVVGPDSGKSNKARVVLEISCRATRYERATRNRRPFWLRENLHVDGGTIVRATSPTFKTTQPTHNSERIIWGGRARVCVAWRRHDHGWLVTVSLINLQTPDEKARSPEEWVNERADKMLFQVGLSCSVTAGSVEEYPESDFGLLDEEQQDLAVQYRHRKVFAVGHGVAADWSLDQEHGRVTELFVEYMPRIEVPQVTADTVENAEDRRTLSLSYLAGISKGTGQRVLSDLEGFVERYHAWICQQHLPSASEHLMGAGERILGRMGDALERMRRSIRHLRTDEQARLAFGLANQAMYDQMKQAMNTRSSNSPDRPSLKEPHWRPFQLGFLLTVLSSTIDEDDQDRDVLDLIWFPTGGGKTEAYLGLIALLIVYRRLRYPRSSSGVVAIMRYTLRLLTAQQFERAAKLICALELIRSANPSLLGHARITAGIWVGNSTTPNTFRTAQSHLEQTPAGLPVRSFLVTKCPWCGMPFASPHSYRASDTDFSFICEDKSCAFRTPNRLPLAIIDESLYQAPPTLLIGTIDKFARLAWEERASAFFGFNGSRPPELVIQDELHLIAGPLGSISGLYEAGLESAIICRGVRPKYVASTATIRMAAKQVRRLYGRSVAVFPPPGLSIDDSYFAKTVPSTIKPGRFYVGYMAPLLDRTRCLAPLSAALIAAPDILFREEVDFSVLMDAWWTQLIYHGSIRGVGISHNALENDCRNRLSSYFSDSATTPLDSTVDIVPARLSRNLRIRQMTSLSTMEDNADTFRQMETRCDAPDTCLDAILATNMVSVGIDVDRLALMVVNGQPLTTGEYIQATSRVGRAVTPGLVFINYYRSQARSISHYEGFRPYHEAFYRYVEPTSVTPFTYQSRSRALHAALVIAVRMGMPKFSSNRSAHDFILDHAAMRTLDILKDRLRRACVDDPLALQGTLSDIDNLCRAWVDRIALSNDSRHLVFSEDDRSRNSDRLLYNYSDKTRGLWLTLQSMRDVEQAALIDPNTRREDIL